MSFLILEVGAAIVALLAAYEMRRQGVSWRSVALRSSVVLAVATGVIVMWRGLG